MVDPAFLRRIVNQLESDPNTEDWIIRSIQWWRQGLTTDQELWNSISWLADENIIESPTFIEEFPQQTIQLVSLGDAIVDVNERLSENIDIRETQRAEEFNAIIENREYLTEINNRLSGQVVELGESLTQLQQEQQQEGFFDNLLSGFGGFGIGAVAVLGIGAFILSKKL